jgi:hypothetical protein
MTPAKQCHRLQATTDNQVHDREEGTPPGKKIAVRQTIYWWSSLHKEGKRANLKQGCSLLETLVMEVFVKFRWRVGIELKLSFRSFPFIEMVSVSLGLNGVTSLGDYVLLLNFVMLSKG